MVPQVDLPVINQAASAPPRPHLKQGHLESFGTICVRVCCRCGRHSAPVPSMLVLQAKLQLARYLDRIQTVLAFNLFTIDVSTNALRCLWFHHLLQKPQRASFQCGCSGIGYVCTNQLRLFTDLAQRTQTAAAHLLRARRFGSKRAAAAAAARTAPPSQLHPAAMSQQPPQQAPVAPPQQPRAPPAAGKLATWTAVPQRRVALLVAIGFALARSPSTCTAARPKGSRTLTRRRSSGSGTSGLRGTSLMRCRASRSVNDNQASSK